MAGTLLITVVNTPRTHLAAIKHGAESVFGQGSR